MLNERGKNLASATLAVIANDGERPTIDRVAEIMQLFRIPLKVSDEEFQAVEAHLHANLIITMDKGVAVSEPKFESWLLHRSATIDWYYWNRYREYLLQRQGFGVGVVHTLNETVDRLLDLAGNPKAEGAWKRRGLIVGSVQSGKTATYVALCNKAADAGFRVIILLAGTLNSLRFQTQQRLDEGFIGFDSAEVSAGNRGKVSSAIGVGEFSNLRAPHAFTDKRGDFSASRLQVRTRLDGMKEPVLMVIKKNKSVLRNLHAWLKTQNPTATGKIQAPLLLIDDEADAASVNTGPESDPKAINAGIRELLTLFARSSYVGVTATPFANVFIAPTSRTEMLDDDLFPKDYIYSLDPPTNYIGPVRMFLDEPDSFLVELDDAASMFPAGHKKDLVVEALPTSMVEAIDSFCLVNAMRDLRGHSNSHRSMLINVSWANGVQSQVASLVKEELRDIVRDAQAFCALDTDAALAASARLRRLKANFEIIYHSSEFDWRVIQQVLFDAIKSVDVRTVNMTSRARLDYEDNKTYGLRVIAIGGNALSRGLTLEGLSTSYIFRNSLAYDTLLQMGRWFGYRPGFDDLCRVWISNQARSWYTHITTATEELREELRRMDSLKSTPRQFGLRIRAHPDALVVTARTKMKTALQITEGVEISGRRFQGVKLPSSEASLQSNLNAVESFLLAIQSQEYICSADKSSRIWSGIPKDMIANLLFNFELHPTSFDFQPQRIAEFLAVTNQSQLVTWDVAISNGSIKELVFAGVPIRPVQRRLLRVDNALEVYKLQLGSGGDEAVGLSKEEKVKADLVIREKRKHREIAKASGSTSGSEEIRENYVYRSHRSRPILIIYLMKPTADASAGSVLPLPDLVASIKLSIPFAEGTEDVENLVMYQANAVYQQMNLGLEFEDEDLELEAAADAG